MSTIESKVYASTLGAGAGSILSAFLLWALGVLFWDAPASAADAVQAAAAVPAPVAGVVALVLTVAGTFAAGYAAPHTPRAPVAPEGQP